MLLFPFIGKMRGTNITPSTQNREPLPAGAVIETDYFADNLFWIDNKAQLEAGMKHFYQKTGVQPFLYITDEVDGCTPVFW